MTLTAFSHLKETKFPALSQKTRQGQGTRENYHQRKGRASPQLALMQVMQELAWGRMDHKTAGLLLYALQTASINLRRAKFEPSDATDVVIDRSTVGWTCIGGPQWAEEDFDEEEGEGEAEGDEEEENEEAGAEAAETEEEAEQDADGEVTAAKPVAASASANDADKVNKPRPPVSANVNMDQARENVKNLARNWILQTLAGKAGRELG